MDFSYIDQALAAGVALGVGIIVFGWVGRVVFHGIRSVEEGSSQPCWEDDH